MQKIVVSLFDRTGNMVIPWAKAGYDCYCFDIQNQELTEVTQYLEWGKVSKIRINLMNDDPWIFQWLNIDPRNIKIIFSFPPCTHVSVSGSRHFKKKGLKKLIESLTLLDRSLDIMKSTNAPWMLENPVSMFSTYWRKPDRYFQPWEYGDNYTKKTSLWFGNGFIMPESEIKEEPSDVDKRKIHYAPPSAERSNLRSITPMGFANAVYEANK